MLTGSIGTTHDNCCSMCDEGYKLENQILIDDDNGPGYKWDVGE
jgi:hypothetical protein